MICPATRHGSEKKNYIQKTKLDINNAFKKKLITKNIFI
jgi:hypothetical protein